MTPNSLGTSSILDTGAIVAQLMEVERRPLQQLQLRETAYEARVSSLSVLLNQLSGFQSSIDSLRQAAQDSMRATVSDPSFLQARATGATAPRSHNIQVGSLAQGQTVFSASFAAVTDAVADLSVQTTQRLRLQTGSSPAAEIQITNLNNSLEGIRDAINGANAGMSAAIVNDGSSYRLLLRADGTGEGGRMTIQVAEDGQNFTGAGGDIDETGLSRLAFSPVYGAQGEVTGGIARMTQGQAGMNARLRVDGLEVTRAGNEITDLIGGVTLNLQRADNFQTTINLSVGRNTANFRERLEGFVSAYNQVVQGVRSMRGEDAMRGETILRTLPGTIRSALATAHEGRTAADIGLVHDREGRLRIEGNRLEAALTGSWETAQGTVNAVFRSLENILDQYRETMIPARQEGYENRIRNVQLAETEMQRRLELTERALTRRYSALDAQLNLFQVSSNFLTQQMDAFTRPRR